jgi:hypothetical protein
VQERTLDRRRRFGSVADAPTPATQQANLIASRGCDVSRMERHGA